MWTMIRKQAPHLDACMHFRKLRCLYILLQCLPLLVHIIVDHLCENNTFIYSSVCV